MGFVDSAATYQDNLAVLENKISGAMPTHAPLYELRGCDTGRGKFWGEGSDPTVTGQAEISDNLPVGFRTIGAGEQNVLDLVIEFHKLECFNYSTK